MDSPGSALVAILYIIYLYYIILLFFPHFFAYFLFFVDMNIFTLLALKSKQIEPLSSAWRHFKDFYLLFLKVRDFDIVFK